jgi:hypothetical protein
VADVLDQATEFDAGLAGFGTSDFTDEELSVLALSADPDQELDPDAVPLAMYSSQSCASLPLWYMPPVMSRGTKRWRTPIVLAIVAALLLINAFGLCITYGLLVAA